jgi:lipopolysaccharide transport system ATP-binding protein
MSDTVIRIENLSKKYVINHQNGGQPYTTLRDVVTSGTKSFIKRANFFRPQNSWRSVPPSSPKEEFWALKDVSFEIKQGDRVGIIGRNGAGKSTLLKILSRITEPTTGQIRIKGRVASLLEVGTGFHPELTGRENIFLNGAILGMSKMEINRKFDEIVAFAEIAKFLDTPVKRYSSGMYVRLAFAVAAHLEPEILVVDEVLAVGDVEFQKKCLGKMDSVAKSGKTVLFVSHNMATVKHLCNQAIVLDKGEILNQGSVQDCIDVYSKNATERMGLIINHQQLKTLFFEVIDIKINGETEDFIHLNSKENIIRVDIKFNFFQKCKLTVETRLKDRDGNVLAVSLPGHINPDKNVYNVSPSHCTLSSEIVLPILNKGSYILDIGLADPGRCVYTSFPSAVKIEASGLCTKSGLVFEQSLTKDGFQVLDSSVYLVSKDQSVDYVS